VTSKYVYVKKGHQYNYYTNKYGNSSASKGTKGKLIESYASSKINGKDWHGERKYYSYDGLGRTTKVRTHIYNKGDYNVESTYDGYSRPKTITYPSGYKVTNYYKDNILESVKGSDGKVHYIIDDLTALGQVSKATYGNSIKTNNYYDNAGYLSSVVSGLGYASGTVQRLNYSYDILGNVKTRNDNSITGKYINETYQYDAMNRLTRFDINSDVKIGSFAKTKTYKYDSIGNITFQTGVGDYKYDGIQPHAVTSTKGATNHKFIYDKNGNMTHNRGRDIVYNPINKPTYLTNKKGEKVSFYYGVGGQRYLKTNGEYATYYIGKLYEEKVGNGYSVEKDYIYAGGKLVGTHKSTTNLFGGETSYATLYFHTDALNSVTAITNSSGTVIERRSYDPFGEIRSMDYKTNNNSIANTTLWTDRAFTGHEQISELDGLVHMNARLYDNVIGRFLSADTIIQAPSDSQSYNRYSYVRNNPLLYTDPSGHSWLSKTWKKVSTYVVIVVVAVLAVYTGGLALAAMGYASVAAATAAGTLGAFGAIVASGAVAGFVAGVAGGLLNGATLGQSMKAGFKGALWGAVSAGVANGIGTAFSGAGTGAAAARALAHGLT
jgi:RHS repeat-associated protein